jgi:tRNA nucleotidyltransferase (CCA-adding enzyme)
VDGDDLIELGFVPGPELGRVLHELLHDVVEDPELNTKDALLGRARAKLPA